MKSTRSGGGPGARRTAGPSRRLAPGSQMGLEQWSGRGAASRTLTPAALTPRRAAEGPSTSDMDDPNRAPSHSSASRTLSGPRSEVAPGGHVRRTRDPELVPSARRGVPIHPIHRTVRFIGRDRGAALATAHRFFEHELLHGPLDCATGHGNGYPVELPANLSRRRRLSGS